MMIKRPDVTNKQVKGKIQRYSSPLKERKDD